MTKLEAEIEQHFVRLCKARGILQRKGSSLAFRGWPDREVMLPNRQILWIEFKRPGQTLTGNQEQIHALLRKHGQEVQVHTDAVEAYQAVERALGTARLPEGGHQVVGVKARSRAVPRPRAR